MTEYMVTPILLHPGPRFEWLSSRTITAESARDAAKDVSLTVRSGYPSTVFTVRAVNVNDYTDAAGEDCYPVRP